MQRVKKDYVKIDKFAIAENDGSVFIDFWEYLTRQFIDKLEYLDLSDCVQRTYLDLEFLKKAGEHLRVLHLHGVYLEYNESTWNVFQKVKKIKYLDVSLLHFHHFDDASIFDNPDTILQNIIKSLPALTGLDISGTNLAGLDQQDLKECCIKGLSERVKNPLNFLGLFEAHHNASFRKNIPAEIITGEATIMQLHTSLKHYLELERLDMCHKVIQDLNFKISSLPDNDDDIEDFIPYQSFINLLCKVMRTRLWEKKILQSMSCATAIVLLNRIRLEHELGDRLMNELFEAALGLIKVHFKEYGVTRNSILILYNCFERKPSIATLLFSVLLTTLKSVVKANEAGSLDVVLNEALTLMCSITNEMGSEVEAELQSPNVVPLLCDVLAILLSKPGLFQHVPTLWVLLSQILSSCKNSRCGELLTKCTAAKCKSKTGQSLEFFMTYLRLCNDYLAKPQVRCQIKISMNDFYIAQVLALSLLGDLLVYSSPTCKMDVFELLDGNVQELLRILELSTPPSYDKEKQEWVLYLTCGILVSAYGKPKQLPNNKKEQQAAISRRNKALTKAYQISLGSDLISSLKRWVFPLNHLYSLLESDVAPEASYWALKSLLNLVEMHPTSCGLKVTKDFETLTSKLVELRDRKKQGKAQKEVQLMCGQLIAKIKLLKRKPKANKIGDNDE